MNPTPPSSPLPRGTRPDAETPDRIHLIKNVSALRATYQVRLLALKASSEGKKLVLHVPAACRFDPSLAELAGAKIDDQVTLAEYSYILMRAFGMKGGVMYSLAPGPRYAYRELVSHQVIQGRSDPGDRVDGPMAVRMLGRVFDIMG